MVENTVTPKMERLTTTEREMERGRQVATRAARKDTLDRWIEAKKIQLFYEPAAKTGDALDVWRAYVGDTLAAQCGTVDYPTEHFVAQIALAIGALSNFHGVEPADPTPRPKSAQALHVAETQRRLHALNPNDPSNYIDVAVANIGNMRWQR